MANNPAELSKYVPDINRTFSWIVDVPTVMPVYADGLLDVETGLPKSQDSAGKRVCMGCVKYLTQENSALEPELSQSWCRKCAVQIYVAQRVKQVTSTSLDVPTVTPKVLDPYYFTTLRETYNTNDRPQSLCTICRKNPVQGQKSPYVWNLLQMYCLDCATLLNVTEIVNSNQVVKYE